MQVAEVCTECKQSGKTERGKTERVGKLNVGKLNAHVALDLLVRKEKSNVYPLCFKTFQHFFQHFFLIFF